MSEKKPSDLILERLDQLEKRLLTTSTVEFGKASSALPEHEAKRNHSTIEEIESCPNCAEKFKLKEYNDKKKAVLEAELRQAILKAERERIKSLREPVRCDGCGEIVEKTEPECPSCHGTHAH